jgi:hypothetical protein
MWERVARILGPKEILGINVVRLFLQSAVFWRLPSALPLPPTYLDRNTIELHVEDVVDQCLVGPRMRQHRGQVDITIQNDQH